MVGRSKPTAAERSAAMQRRVLRGLPRTGETVTVGSVATKLAARGGSATSDVRAAILALAERGQVSFDVKGRIARRWAPAPKRYRP